MQYIFRVFNPSPQLTIRVVSHLVQAHELFHSSLAGKLNYPLLCVQQNLAEIKEIHLENAVTQSKHDRVFGLQPLPHIDQVLSMLGSFFRKIFEILACFVLMDVIN